jgi:small subunit ribosomal protein S18
MVYRDNRRDREREGGGFGSKGTGKMVGGRRRREKKEDVLTRVRKKTCRFCEEKALIFDYKDMRRFERLISERGKILSRRITGVCAKHQRKVEDVVKKARFMALFPFLKH